MACMKPARLLIRRDPREAPLESSEVAHGSAEGGDVVPLPGFQGLPIYVKTTMVSVLPGGIRII